MPSKSAVITVTVTDADNGSAQDTFQLTVTSDNDLPTISDIADQTIAEDGNTGALAFTVSDTETPAANLTLSAGSSNPGLVPTGNIVFGGVGRGVLLGIELVTDRDKKTPADAQAERMFKKCFDDGLIFQIRGTRGLRNVIRLVPPMTTTDDEVDRAMSIIHDAFRAI